jgi:hypothetical protein
VRTVILTETESTEPHGETKMLMERLHQREPGALEAVY